MTDAKKRIKYVPEFALKELNNIKREEDIFSNSEAWRKMARYSVLGRESVKAKRGNNLRINVQLPKRKKKGGLFDLSNIRL